MANSKNEDLFVQKRKDDPIISYPEFAQPGKLTLQQGIRFRLFGKVLLDLFEYPTGFRFAEMREVFLYALFICNVIGQGTSSDHARK